MDKALNFIGLAKKARRIELGEEPVGAVARAQKARLVIVASDAGDHTWRRAQSFVNGTKQQCVQIPFTKDQLGLSVGRTSLAIAAFTDPALALAFLKALEQPEKYKNALLDLQERTLRLQQRQSEAEAHLRNKQRGRTHRGADTKKQ